MPIFGRSGFLGRSTATGRRTTRWLVGRVVSIYGWKTEENPQAVAVYDKDYMDLLNDNDRRGPGDRRPCHLHSEAANQRCDKRGAVITKSDGALESTSARRWAASPRKGEQDFAVGTPADNYSHF